MKRPTMKTLLLLAILSTMSLPILSEEIRFDPMLESYAEGDNLTLTCGHTPDHVCKWTRSGRKVDLELEKRYDPADNGTCSLTISPITAEDDGRWKCVISPVNSTDQSVTLTKRLIVDDPNFITGAQLSTDVPTYVEVEAGTKAELRCHFKSSAPACFWTKDGDVIAIKGRYHYSGDKHDGDCSIEIENANYRDDGQWQCCYPRMDNWPVTKSPNITLNVTVTPKDPVISVQGIGMDEGVHIYVSTATTKYINNPNIPSATTFSTPQIACWSANGNPAALLSWTLEDVEGNSLDFKETSQITSWNVKGQQNLKVICNRLQGQQQRANPASSVRQVKLKCNAQHPNYIGQTKTTFVWLNWDDTVHPQYYG